MNKEKTLTGLQSNRALRYEKHARYGVIYSVMMLLMCCIISITATALHEGVSFIVFGGGMSSLGLLIHKRGKRKSLELTQSMGMESRK